MSGALDTLAGSATAAGTQLSRIHQDTLLAPQG
jgi:hypothetical protein